MRTYVERRADGSLRLRHTHGGKKVWDAIYYLDGRPRSAKLGTYPEMSIAQARKAQAKFEPPARTDCSRVA